MSRLAITAPRIWLRPGVVLEGGHVLCEEGAIASVSSGPAPDDVDRVDVDGFLMPAGADRHVHVGLSDPAAILAGGITAVRDLAWPPDRIFPLAELSDGPAFEGPLIRAAGPMLTAPGGYPARAAWAPDGTAWELVDGAAAAAAVDELADRGAAAIKVSLNAEAGPVLDDATLVAIVEAATRRGLIVTAHAQGRGQVERALGAGVRELAHAPWTPLSDAVVAQAATQLRIVSTLDTLSFGRESRELRVALDNAGRFLAAGGELIYGTDLGNGSIPPGIHRGELEHLRAAGLDADAVLGALIRAPLEEGAPADLLVLRDDPLEDLSAFDRITAVIKAGAVVQH